MSVFAAFRREVRDARAIRERPHEIHVTSQAVEGSVVTVLARYEHDEGSREVREIRVHPEDWRDFLTEEDVIRYGVWTHDGQCERVMGIPVRHS